MSKQKGAVNIRSRYMDRVAFNFSSDQLSKVTATV